MPKLFRTKFIPVTLLVSGIFMVAGGFYINNRESEPATTQVPPRVIARHTDEPSEEKPDADADYEVAADMPRRLIIPAINVNGFVQQVGTVGDRSVGTPDNIFVAGWYVDSTKPGEKGLSIVDGHVSGWHHDGIFKRLGELSPGSRIHIEFGDYSVRKFEVVEVAEYSENRASAQLFKQKQGINSQLNLITCSDPFNRQSEKYQNRTIVAAKLIE